MEEILKKGISLDVIHIARNRVYTGTVIIMIIICLHICIMAGKVSDRITNKVLKSIGCVAEEHITFAGISDNNCHAGVLLAEIKAMGGIEMMKDTGANIKEIELPAVTVVKAPAVEISMVEDTDVISDITEDSDTESNDTENDDAQEGESVVEIPGFVINESGYITDISVSLVDGLLVLPADVRCKGILAGAFSGIEEEVLEICIPANIIYIESGALDVLQNLLYIQVMEGNPEYYSFKGILYYKDGTEVFCPGGRKKN